jgi:hypothetical protein
MVSRTKKTALWICVAGGAFGAALLFVFDPVTVPFYPACMFHRLTALDCPGCGGLRALHELLHGRVVAAMHYNLIVVLSVPIFVWLGWRVARGVLGDKPGVDLRPAWVWAYLGVWIVFGVLRNLRVVPFDLFAP